MVGDSPLRLWAGEALGVDMTDRRQRLGLNPVVRAHLDRRHAEASRAERYGSLLTCFRVVPDLSDAEVAVVAPVVGRSLPDGIRGQIAAAESHGLRTLVFGSHDLEPIMPSASVILLHPGPTRGAQPHADVLALPYLFADRSHGVPTRTEAPRPTVAFCGQGRSRPLPAAGHASRRAGALALNRLRRRTVTAPIRGHVSLRAAALRHLAGHPEVDDHFVIRDRYRASSK